MGASLRQARAHGAPGCPHSLLRRRVVIGHEAEAIQHGGQLLKLLVCEHAQLVGPAVRRRGHHTQLAQPLQPRPSWHLGSAEGTASRPCGLPAHAPSSHARKTPQVTFPAEWPSARSQGMARSWVLTGRACRWRSSRDPAPLLPSALETAVSPAPGGPIHTWAQVPQASPASPQLRARCYEQSALSPKASGLGQARAQVACLLDTPGLLAHPLCLQQPLGLQPCPRASGPSAAPNM